MSIGVENEHECTLQAGSSTIALTSTPSAEVRLSLNGPKCSIMWSVLAILRGSSYIYIYICATIYCKVVVHTVINRECCAVIDSEVQENILLSHQGCYRSRT